MKGKVFFLVSLCIFFVSHGIESPQFTVVHSESDFEVRLYRKSSWMSAPVRGISFEKATRGGFHRLYQYIHGSNFNSSQLAMTAPVLASIIPKAQSPETQYFVSFYLATQFQGVPPSPLPELNLQLNKWGSHCVGVRNFSGFATDNNVSKEAESLVTSLSRSNSTIVEDKNTYMIAYYWALK